VEELLETDLRFRQLPLRERRLTQELVYGVVRWQSLLDWLVSRRMGGRRVKRLLLQLLRLGVYQILWLDRVPDHAAVNETVELAKEVGFSDQAGLVNAILRAYAREKDQAWEAIRRLQEENPARGWSHPRWLADRWTARWGREKTLRLLAWNNEPPPVCARVNLLKTKPWKLIEKWREEGVEYDFGQWDWVPENLFFFVRVPRPIEQLESYREGWFYIQDPSTLLAVKALDPQPEERILDLCAAPGGKTTLAAQQMDDDGRILALDVSPERVKLIEANCARLGIRCVVAGELPDEAEGEEPADGWFDRALVDAPCSNTGVIRRRVDLRWRVRPDEIERLAALQRRLLHRASLTVRPGGVLVYSTCSLEPEENRQVVEAFLADHPEYRLDWDRELFPPEVKADGAYAARLVRAGQA